MCYRALQLAQCEIGACTQDTFQLHVCSRTGVQYSLSELDSLLSMLVKPLPSSSERDNYPLLSTYIYNVLS